MKTLTFPQTHQGYLLFKCLAFSLILHSAAVTFLYYNPLILQGSLKSLFGMSAATPSLLDSQADNDLLQKNHLLDEVFEQIIVLSPHFQQPYDLVELPKGIALAPNQEDSAFEIASRVEKIDAPSRDFMLASTTLAQDHQERNIPSLFAPPEIGAPIASQLQVDGNPAIPELTTISIPLLDAVFMRI